MKSKMSLISLTTLLLLCAQSAWSDCSLSSSWEPWEPYQFELGNNVTGLDNDIVKAVFEKAGCAVKFVKRPWARTLIEVESGTVDLTPGASALEERKKYANFSDPYRDELMVLMVRKGESAKYPLTKLEDIKSIKFSLGIVRDYFYSEDFKTALLSPNFKARVSEVSDDDTNLKKLVAGRIDGLLIDKYAGPYLAKKQGFGDQVEIHPVKVDSNNNGNNVHLMFSKKSVPVETIDKINAALQALRASGEYDKIINGYIK